MTAKLTKKARELLEDLATMKPGQFLIDYDRSGFNALHKLGLADWMPCGWAGFGIHITDKGRTFLAPQPPHHSHKFLSAYPDSFAA